MTGHQWSEEAVRAAGLTEDASGVSIELYLRSPWPTIRAALDAALARDWPAILDRARRELMDADTATTTGNTEE